MPILMYHGFTGAERPRGLQNREGIHTDIAQFRKQMQYLSRHHKVITLGHLADALQGNVEWPDHAVVVTMDDGYMSNYTQAFPVLKEYGVPATIFVSTAFVEELQPLWPDRVEWMLDTAAPQRFEFEFEGQPLLLDLRSAHGRSMAAEAVVSSLKMTPQERRDQAIETLERTLDRQLRFTDTSIPEFYRPLTWGQLNEMRRSGLVAIGNHAHTHRILSRCSHDGQLEEISRAAVLIKERTEAQCDLFCYPNGQPSDFDSTTKTLLGQAGYRCAVTTVSRMSMMGDDPFELPRLAIGQGISLEEFLVLLYGGLRDFLHAPLGRNRAHERRHPTGSSRVASGHGSSTDNLPRSRGC